MCLFFFSVSFAFVYREYAKKQWQTEINSHDSIENEIHIAIFALQLHVRRQDDKKKYNQKMKVKIS